MRISSRSAAAVRPVSPSARTLHRADTLPTTVPVAAQSGAHEVRTDNTLQSRQLKDNSRNTWMYNLRRINIMCFSENVNLNNPTVTHIYFTLYYFWMFVFYDMIHIPLSCESLKDSWTVYLYFILLYCHLCGILQWFSVLVIFYEYCQELSYLVWLHTFPLFLLYLLKEFQSKTASKCHILFRYYCTPLFVRGLII
jgi:hypothetical protein